ncbi:MAG TPA: TetR/AcrR family transcriptional regulator [Polyangiaceae bacterium]|nr:TetR/AcrR family transcriptional regulator [Polyangiaceae bacterium]
MSLLRKRRDFTPKKRPAQARSRDTFDALVEACTWLLPRRGYTKTTTNHIAERAGVNIASLYEYFPGKDAIVAQVAERLVERVLARLEQGLPRVIEGGEANASRLWIELIYDSVLREKTLVAVFLNQIPYTYQLEPIRALAPRLLEFSLEVQRRAQALVRFDFSAASLHLLINLVSSTIMQLVLNPPEDVPVSELLDELARRMEEWIRPAPV